MSLKNSDAFLDELIAELHAMKEDPEKDTVARVISMVFRVARKHRDSTTLKRSIMMAVMSIDGIDRREYEILKRWEAEADQ